MTVLACDISEFQVPVDDSYAHPWLTFRACDGTYVDKKVAGNLAWAIKARESGKIAGFTVYVVYRPGDNGYILATLDKLGVPHDCHVMVDVESWSGEITGDHSTEINALCVSLTQRQGDRSRVWGYANLNDYATIWRYRPAWLGLVVASYGGSKPTSPGPGPLIGWQYTDGTWSVPGLPSSSAPFGACDHNQLYITGGLTMDAEVQAAFDAINKKIDALIARFQYTYANGTNVGGTVQGIVRNEIGAAFGAHPASASGLTEADVETAVRNVFKDAAGGTA